MEKLFKSLKASMYLIVIRYWLMWCEHQLTVSGGDFINEHSWVLSFYYDIIVRVNAT